MKIKLAGKAENIDTTTNEALVHGAEVRRVEWFSILRSFQHPIQTSTTDTLGMYRQLLKVWMIELGFNGTSHEDL